MARKRDAWDRPIEIEKQPASSSRDGSTPYGATDPTGTPGGEGGVPDFNWWVDNIGYNNYGNALPGGVGGPQFNDAMWESYVDWLYQSGHMGAGWYDPREGFHPQGPTPTGGF